MNKKLFIIFIVLFIFGCAAKTEINNNEIVLTGTVDRNTLSAPEFPWFNRNYKNYVLPKESAVEISSLLKNDISCKIFMGTWCSDSRRDVPKFYKITDSTGFKSFEITALDEKKNSPSGTEKEYKIEKVPTFIFFKSGKEIGRIIENPVKSMHEDLIEILKKNN